MYASRDQTRQVFLDVWRKLRQKRPLEPMEALIADVIALHPEYHPLLDDPERALGAEYSPDSGQGNPFLHMAMHIALHEQADTDRPTGIRALHRKLCARQGRHDAEHAMMECLGQALWEAQRSGQMPDETAYLDCLKRLLP
jgi:hypothetical protein